MKATRRGFFAAIAAIFGAAPFVRNEGVQAAEIKNLCGGKIKPGMIEASQIDTGTITVVLPGDPIQDFYHHINPVSISGLDKASRTFVPGYVSGGMIPALQNGDDLESGRNAG